MVTWDNFSESIDLVITFDYLKRHAVDFAENLLIFVETNRLLMFEYFRMGCCLWVEKRAEICNRYG